SSCWGRPASVRAGSSRRRSPPPAPRACAGSSAVRTGASRRSPSAVAPAGWPVILGRSYETEQMLALGVWAGAFRAAGLAARRDALADLGAAWRAELARVPPHLPRPHARAPRAARRELG